MTKEEFKYFCERNNGYLICYHEAIGRYEMINSSVAAVTGFSRDEILGKNPYDFIHPEDKEHFQNTAHLPCLEGKLCATEYRFRKKDGNYTWLRTEIAPVKNDNGQVTHMLTTTKDISELVALRYEGAITERLFDDTCRIAEIGTWMLDIESMTTTWSRAVYDIHEAGYDYEPDLDTVFDFFPGEAKQVFAEAMSNTIDRGIPFDIMLPFITARGNKTWLRAIGKAKIKYGKTSCIYGVFQNVKKIAEDINELYEQLKGLQNENAMLCNIVMSMQLVS